MIQYPLASNGGFGGISTDGWMVIATLLLGAIAFWGDSIWEWWRKPKMSMKFDSNLERCYRNAIAEEEFLMDQGYFNNVKRQFFRLKVVNRGLTSVRNLRAKVELYDIQEEEIADRFEPNALNWISGSGSVDLAPNEEDYLNLVSQVLEPLSEADYHIPGPNNSVITRRASIKYKFRVEIVNHSLRGITWDRKLQPWKLRVALHADNLTKPVIKFFKFTPPEEGEAIGKLEETSGWN